MWNDRGGTLTGGIPRLGNPVGFPRKLRRVRPVNGLQRVLETPQKAPKAPSTPTKGVNAPTMGENDVDMLEAARSLEVFPS